MYTVDLKYILPNCKLYHKFSFRLLTLKIIFVSIRNYVLYNLGFSRFAMNCIQLFCLNHYLKSDEMEQDSTNFFDQFYFC